VAKGQYLSSAQRGIVRRFYTHRETVLLTRLQEAVTDLFLAKAGGGDAKAAARTWKSVGEALRGLGVEATKIDRILESQSPESLAAMVGELSGK
jgi:hypothetical protein